MCCNRNGLNNVVQPRFTSLPAEIERDRRSAWREIGAFANRTPVAQWYEEGLIFTAGKEAWLSDVSAGPDRVIFVNRRRFALPVTAPTGADIAGLLGVPADNAVVERETADGLIAEPLDTPLSVADGAAFLVTRQFIMGGHRGRGDAPSRR